MYTEPELSLTPYAEEPGIEKITLPGDFNTSAISIHFASDGTDFYVVKQSSDNSARPEDNIVYQLGITGALKNTVVIKDSGSGSFFPRAITMSGDKIYISSSTRAYLYNKSDFSYISRISYDLNDTWIRGCEYYNNGLILSASGKKTLYRLSLDTNTTSPFVTLPEGASPRGLAVMGNSLFVVDIFHDIIYEVGLTSKNIIREYPLTSGVHHRGIAAHNGTLYMADNNGSYLKKYRRHVANEFITRADPVSTRIKQSIIIDNQNTMGGLKDIYIYSAIPQNTVHQKITSITYHGGTPEIQKDKYGWPIAVFSIKTIVPIEKVEIGWTAEAQLWGVRYNLPDSIQKTELPGDSKEYVFINDPGHPYLSENSTGLSQIAQSISSNSNNLLQRIRNTRNTVWDRLTYELDGSWEDAETVYNQSLGSCSEYSFLTSNLFRNQGVATRFVGATVNLKNEPGYIDQIYHRWLEVYHPEVGWIAMDANRNDSSNASVYSNEFVPAIERSCLVLSKGGGNDSNFLGIDYTRRIKFSWASSGGSNSLVKRTLKYTWENIE